MSENNKSIGPCRGVRVKECACEGGVSLMRSRLEQTKTRTNKHAVMYLHAPFEGGLFFFLFAQQCIKAQPMYCCKR